MRPELLLLHALPLDGSMWAAQLNLLPGATYAPTLYGFGDCVQDWAAEALKLPMGNKLIVVGCSVGGSCALEVAALAPDRVAGLIIIGTKAARRVDSRVNLTYADDLQRMGLKAAWAEWWKPAFSPSTSPEIIAEAEGILMRQPLEDVVRGVRAFHSRQSRGDVLSTFRGPVHVVTGDADVLPGTTTSVNQAASAYNGYLHVIPDCGHYVPMERPAALNSIIKHLIDQLTPSGWSRGNNGID
ncbi:alpha/beta fold hydrolase [Agrobacterium tumefaciens]|uniref:alpha/beta fold hydrolase n=1 Tax=Agrobacterium tumefaciens TaxID=358 RepID=UPI00129B78D5|nr:alpha/beta hydrolase [Agrobacterium tumefaciens]MRH96354.1 alpha/beta fold hydrolase [Agrobacterium tumefaciens]WCK68897.1 alpha/beta hydrolase [Agrobacterium tumefaciens]